MHFWWIIIAFSLFLENEVFFHIIFMISYSLKGKAKKSFRHLAPSLLHVFIKFFF